MVQKKKKAKSPARKQSKSVTKKSIKAKAKKKVTASTKKKAKTPARKKVSLVTSRKTKAQQKKTSKIRKPKMETPPAEIQVPEVVKHDEVMPATPISNVVQPDPVEKNKILENQFENRAEVIMNQENQRVKSAMANRQATRRVFHTQRHS